MGDAMETDQNVEEAPEADALQEGNDITRREALLERDIHEYPVVDREVCFFPGGAGGPFSLPGAPGGGGGKPDPVSEEFQLSKLGGLEKEIKYLERSVILPWVNPKAFEDWGVSAPKGILLHGPPGTGKTYLAKAIVNKLKEVSEKNVNFFHRKGGDVFSMWFGESQRKLKEVFQTAAANKPAVLFFDEIDGLCPSRENRKNHGTDAYNEVVTCFLGQMDEVKNGEVFVIAATNRLETVDPAVRRPGRFDKLLEFSFPDESSRKNIIQIHTKKWSADEKKHLTEELLSWLARRTVGYSGADLEVLCANTAQKAINEQAVKEIHWKQALYEMQPTKPDNFGSYLFIPLRPAEAVLSVVHPVVETAFQKIQPFISARSLAEGTQTTRKSLLLYTNGPSSKSFLNSQILSAILSDQRFNKISSFKISPEFILNKILTSEKPTLVSVITETIKQAEDASRENPACVVVSNVDEILELAHANNLPTGLVLNSLNTVRGPKMLLLATSSVPMDQIKDLDIIDTFPFQHNQMLVKNLEKHQLIPLFLEMFEKEAADQRISKEVKEIWQSVAEQAAERANNHDFEDILSLISVLSSQPIRNNSDKLRAEYQKILTDYETTKLRST